MTAGEEAERLVTERIRAAFPEADVRVYPNVSWVAPTRDGGPAVDGEADLVIASGHMTRAPTLRPGLVRPTKPDRHRDPAGTLKR